MTKILHITTIPMTFIFLTGQVKYMKDKGFDVHALSSPGELLDSFARSEQVPVHAVKMLRQIAPLHDLVVIFHLWRRLRILRPQIVHAHTPKGGLLGMIAAWLARVPVRIYHVHGLRFMTTRGYRRFLLRWSEKISCFLAHRVFCVSNSIREVTVAEDFCPAAKVKVLVNGSINGVDAFNQFNPANVGGDARLAVRRKYGIPDEALVVGFVGRIVYDKGVVELAEAWKALSKEFATLHLLVVGPFEPENPVPPDVERLLRADPRVHLTGLVNDIPPFYAAIDVLVLPSYREGFGLVAIEAAAMELPVVATRIPGCVDAVQDRVTGTLVPPHDPEAIAEAIRRYLHDPVLRRQHGKAGRERVLRDFRQEPIWEALYQEYEHLLQKNQHRRGN